MAIHWMEKLQLHCPRASFSYPNSATINEAERVFSKRGIPIGFMVDVIDWASDQIPDISACDPTPDVLCGWQARRETWLAAQREAQTFPARMEALRERLRTAMPGDRWEIICQAHDQRLDMRGLEAYAESLPGGNPGQKQSAEKMHRLLQVSGLIGKAQSPVGEGYVEVAAGEALRETDESLMEDGTWRPFGKDSIDRMTGHPRRLFKYANTRPVRRKI